jgi:hypothetical protein
MKLPVYASADGSVVIVRLNPKHRRPDETEDEFVERMSIQELAKATTVMPELTGAVRHLVDEADIPPRGPNRHKLRIRQRGGKPVLEVDPTVPDRPGGRPPG